MVQGTKKHFITDNKNRIKWRFDEFFYFVVLKNKIYINKSWAETV